MSLNCTHVAIAPARPAFRIARPALNNNNHMNMIRHDYIFVNQNIRIYLVDSLNLCINENSVFGQFTKRDAGGASPTINELFYFGSYFYSLVMPMRLIHVKPGISGVGISVVRNI